MRRILIAVFAVAVATSAFADGAATYKAKCAACHGPDAKGAKMAPNAIAGLPTDQVKKAIAEGKGKMKPVKIDDADDVAAYVSGLKK